MAHQKATPEKGALTLSRASCEAVWNAALAGHSGVTPFHAWNWLRTHSQLQGWRFEPLVVSRGDDILGAIPLLLERKGPLWAAPQIPFPYAGPILAAADLPAALKAVSRWSTPRRIALNRFDFHLPTDEQIRLLESEVGTVYVGRTWVVDLSHGDPEKLYAGYTRNTKKALRIAERAGIHTREATVEEAAAMLPRLLEQSYGAHDATNPYRYDEAGWKAVCSGLYVAGAYLGDTCVGILAVPTDSKMAFDWIGGCLREVRDTRANFALHVHLFNWAMAQGYESFDLVGEVDQNVGAFKAGFGAVPDRWLLVRLPPGPWRLPYRLRKVLKGR